MDQCELKVLGLEEWSVGPDGPDTAYRVRGEAGSGAVVWLSARTAQGKYISGKGVNVGPGPFEAIVELKLTGRPTEYLVVLEVAGRRCKAKAPNPS